MPKKPQPSSANQTTIGNDNIEVIGNDNVISRITNFFSSDTDAKRTQRNRHAVLELVKNTWIKGVLERSLYNEVLIALGLEERPGAVDHPWDMQVQMFNQTIHSLHPGTSITEVFDEMNGVMLILGQPGAGKTTMLLELAREKIIKAEQDVSFPIPVILNLSTWSQRKKYYGLELIINLIRRFFRKPVREHFFADWLTDELNKRYFISRRTIQYWMECDDLLLLLDGLDEIKEARDRVECVQAINEFRIEHGFTKLAISSRISDYEKLALKLNLQGAVYLQPLTLQQIDEYLSRGGSTMDALRKALQRDDVLMELAQQPLMLSVMTLAYRNIPFETLVGERYYNLEMERKHLFDTYIRQMFTRVSRTINNSYSPEEAMHWLAWLAGKIARTGSSPFLLSEIDPSWLETDELALLYKVIFWTSRSLFWVLSSGLLVGIFGWLRWGGGFGLDYWIKDEIFIGINIFLVTFLLGPDTKIRKIPNPDIQPMIKGTFLVGLSYVLYFWLVNTLVPGSGFWVAFGLFLGPLLGPFFMLLGGWDDFISHYILRVLVYKRGYIPWNYAQFLDYAVDRIFMYKVGYGYIFIHPLLADHFASMF